MDTAYRHSISHRLTHGTRPVIADGAVGSMLLKRLPPSHPAWEGHFPCCEILNRTAADVVCDLHSAYVRSGAEIITTNTFCATPIMLSRFGLEGEAASLIARAVELAQQAINPVDLHREVFVAGSVGPIVIGERSFTDNDLDRTYDVQIGSLSNAGVDLLLIETVVSLRQLRAALTAAKKAKDTPVWVSLAPLKGQLFPIDGTVGQAVATCAEFGVSIVGANCGEGPRSLESTLRQLSSLIDGPLYCAPSAGIPDTTAEPLRYPIDSESFFSEVGSLLESYNILVLGGCCGTTPEHIARLRALALHRSD